MSNPNATAILAGLTSWWAFDGDVTDAHGTNDLTVDTSAGFEAGLKGTQWKLGSRGKVDLASTIAFSETTGRFTIGGWVTFAGGGTDFYVGGLTTSDGTTNEVLYFLVNPSGVISVVGWEDAGSNQYSAIDSGVRRTAYPITVRVEDSGVDSATSDQVIFITEAGNNPPGRYFLVATYDQGAVTLYIDTAAVATDTAADTLHNSITRFQIGADGYGVSSCAVDEWFLLSNTVLTPANITYLYNAGQGKSYAELVADA